MAESKLTTKKIESLKSLDAWKRAGEPRWLSDGGGLRLQLTPSKDGKTVNMSGEYRYAGGSIGLGPLTPTRGIADLRKERNRWRDEHRAGRDPITIRRQEEQARAFAESGTKDFASVFEDYLDATRHTWRSRATEVDWRGQFKTHVLPVVGKLATADIRNEHVDRILKPIWGERGQLLRQRLETVFDAALALGYRSAENPARGKRVRHALGKRPRHIETHMRAMPLEGIGAFVARLRERQQQDPADPAGWALELLIHTAVRADQIRLMKWGELDLDGGTWSSPGAQWDSKGRLVAKGNTKSGRDHRIALSPRAVEILRAMPAGGPGDYVFSLRPGLSLGRNTVRIWAKNRLGFDATLHGFRSVFRSWVATHTKFPRELAEFALDHRTEEIVGDATELSYMRSDLLDRRRPMMKAWSSFIDRPSEPAKVIPIHPMAAAG
jgi:integrase